MQVDNIETYILFIVIYTFFSIDNVEKCRGTFEIF